MSKKYFIFLFVSFYFFNITPLYSKDGDYAVCREYLFESNENISESQSFLEKIVREEPGNIRCLVKLADLYLKNNKISRGFDLLRRAYELDPSYVEKRSISKILDIALKFSRLKEYAVKKNDPKLWNELGDDYFDMGIFNEAAAAYKKSLKLDENQTKIHIYAALSLYNMSQTYSAIEHLITALKLDEDNFYANYYLAKILKNELDDLKKALKYFQKAKKILQKIGVKGFESKEEYNYFLNDLRRETNGQ